MTESERKEKISWLNRYQESLLQEKRLTAKLKEIRSRAESTTQALTGMPSGGWQISKVESGAILLVAYAMRLNEEIVDGELARAEIEAAVGQIEDPMQREVLYWRYINGENGHQMDFHKVGNKLYFSERHARRLHNQALENLIIPKDGRSCPV